MALRMSMVRLTDSMPLVRGEVVNRDRRRRRAARHDGVRQHAKSARKALARDAACVQVAIQQLLRRDSAAPCMARSSRPSPRPGIAQGVGLRVVEQHAVAERSRIVRARGKLRGHLQLLAVEEQHAARLEPGDVHAALGAVHVVEVQLVEHQRAVLAARVVGLALEPELVRQHVQRPVELAPVQVEGEDAVEAGGGEEQAPFVDRDLVAVLEVGVAPGAEPAGSPAYRRRARRSRRYRRSRRRRRCRAGRGPSRGPASRCRPCSSRRSGGPRVRRDRSGRRRRGFRPGGCRGRPKS